MTKPDNTPTELDDCNLDMIGVAGGTREIKDHIGAYNFKVEIEGVTQGAFKTSWETVTDGDSSK